MTTAVSPGPFDSVTLGHVDIAVRVRTLADEVILAIDFNASKRHAFDLAQRLAMAEAVVGGLDGVCAIALLGLLVDLCKELGVDVVVKGLRGEADFSAEKPMALMNCSLTGIETVFVLGNPASTHIASSLVKDVARHGGNVTDLVPPGVVEAFAGIHHTEEQ